MMLVGRLFHILITLVRKKILPMSGAMMSMEKLNPVLLTGDRVNNLNTIYL